MKDPQKKRVYAWESEWFDWNRSNLTLKECRTAVKWACKHYGLPPPQVRQHHTQHHTSCTTGPKKSVISFRTDQKNAAAALHEVAHYICDKIFGFKMESHGAHWMGIYLWLLEGARIAPRTALHASAKARRIKWVQTWLVSPKRLGRGR